MTKLLDSRGSLFLDLIEDSDITYLAITKYFKDESSDVVVFIYWDQNEDDCYIKSFTDHLQNYIISFEEFKEFIYLVDTAYDYLRNKMRSE